MPMSLPACWLLALCVFHVCEANWNQYSGGAGKTNAAVTAGNAPNTGAGATPVLIGDSYTSSRPVQDDQGNWYGLTRGAMDWTLQQALPDGTIGWEVKNSEFTSGQVSVCGQAVIVEGKHQTFAIDPVDGHTLWNAAMGGMNSVLTTSSMGSTLYKLDGVHLKAFDVETGKVNWSMNLTGYTAPEYVVMAVGGGVLFVPSVGLPAGHIRGFDAKSGKQLFATPYGNSNVITTVYVGATSGSTTQPTLALVSITNPPKSCFTLAVDLTGKVMWNSTNVCHGTAIASKSTTFWGAAAKSSSTAVTYTLTKFSTTTGKAISSTTAQLTHGANQWWFRIPIILDEGSSRVYFCNSSNHMLTSVDTDTMEVKYVTQPFTLKRRNGGDKVQVIYPIALQRDGSVVAMIYTGRGGSYDEQYEQLLVSFGNKAQAPDVKAPIWWTDNKIASCPIPQFEPGYDVGFTYALQIQNSTTGFWDTVYEKPAFPTVYMRTPTTPCLTSHDLPYGKYNVRVAVNSTSDDSQVGYSAVQQIVLGNSTAAKGPQCSQFWYLGKPGTNKMGSLAPTASYWGTTMPKVVNATGYPGDSNVLRWTASNVSCALNGIQPQQPIFGGLDMEADAQELHYEDGYDNVIGRTAKGKARLTIDYNGDGKTDYQEYWPSEKGAGQPFYIFSHLYDGVYTLKHDDPVMFNFPPLQNTPFNGGSIELAVWVTASPPEVPDCKIQAVSDHNGGRGPKPYNSGIRFPFASDKPSNALGCNNICPDAFYYDSYWGN